jgi:hypothetical protein
MVTAAFKTGHEAILRPDPALTQSATAATELPRSCRFQRTNLVRRQAGPRRSCMAQYGRKHRPLPYSLGRQLRRRNGEFLMPIVVCGNSG